MNRKSLLVSSLILTILLSVSCTTIKQIGDINMISNRNIESSANYKVLTTYSGGSKKDLRKSRANTLQQAVDETVRETVGGEYLVNVKIYVVNQRYYAVEGDVWGKGDEVPVNGFKVGDKVTWKELGSYKTGKVIAVKGKVCLIEQDKNKKTVDMDYHNLTKVQ